MSMWLRLLLLVPLGLWCTSCATDFVTGETVYNVYSMDEEVSMGRQFMQDTRKAMLDEGIPVIQTGPTADLLREMTIRIASVSDRPGLPYDVTLFATSVVNAAAMPGGQMMVFEGLYDPEEGLVRDSHELAAVMAHEIAHVNCRHSTEELSKHMTAAVVFELAAVVAESKDKSDVADALRAAFVIGELFLMPVYSREQEREADKVGMVYMARAGYDPAAAVRVWKHAAEMEKKDGDEGGGILSVFATHPPSKERAAYLEELLPHVTPIYEQVRSGGYAAPVVQMAQLGR